MNATVAILRVGSALVTLLFPIRNCRWMNSRIDPHLVAGDAAIMAWYHPGALDKDDAVTIAKYLDQARKTYGVEVYRRISAGTTQPRRSRANG